MTHLTRRERDAVVGLATVFAVSFLAGVFSYQIGDTVIYDYQTALNLLWLAGIGFLAYRVARRVGTALYKRGRQRWGAGS